MSSGALVCRDTTWLVSDSRERALTDVEKAALEAHIAICPMCQGASRQFEVLFRGLDAMLRNDLAGTDSPSEPGEG